MIDLRSDTVTKPTPGMRAAMAAAEVGDDVWREDPTIHRLEARVAEMLGKEAALFVPSGTMSNQIAVRLHTRPGDELLCDANAHLYVYEAGGPAVLSGVTCQPLPGDYGILSLEQVRDNVRPLNEHLVRTRLVCLENTHNRGGGRIYPLELTAKICAWARGQGLALHLDGARLWNAVVATGTPADRWASHFDTVSVCFSKGLGAPVGSALVGPRDMIERGRYVRKLFGGAMRQAGILAAGALYALDHHIDRLAEDHANAKLIAEAVAETPGMELTPPVVDTNLIWFRVDPRLGTPAQLAEKLKAEGILIYPASPTQLRACTHLDVSRAQAEQVARAIRRLGGARTP
jgi:threonine aldolase